MRDAKSGTTGYDVQHSEAEWAQMLSPQQSFILRQGGTESPYSSILEGEGVICLCRMWNPEPLYSIQKKSLVAGWMLLAWMER
jgi:peptide methionine sulfoxide reductase MsrB